jgi:hypothetical protein
MRQDPLGETVPTLWPAYAGAHVIRRHEAQIEFVSHKSWNYQTIKYPEFWVSGWVHEQPRKPEPSIFSFSSLLTEDCV